MKRFSRLMLKLHAETIQWLFYSIQFNIVLLLPLSLKVIIKIKGMPARGVSQKIVEYSILLKVFSMEMANTNWVNLSKYSDFLFKLRNFGIQIVLV